MDAGSRGGQALAPQPCRPALTRLACGFGAGGSTMNCTGVPTSRCSKGGSTTLSRENQYSLPSGLRTKP